MSLLITIAISSLAGAGVVLYFFLRRKKIHTKEEATILLERVKQVCKLVTIEGHFVEVFDHSHKKSVFFGLIEQNKKALLIIKGRAFVGIDLTKAKFEIHQKTKTIRIKTIPLPEIIGVESDIRFYDIQESVFNKFKAEEYTDLNRKAVEKIRKQIQKSDLMEQVHQQALGTLHIIGTVAETVGWRFEISRQALD